MTPFRILLVSACARNGDRLELDRDERAIKECLALSGHSDDCLKTCPAATIDDFRRALMRWPGKDDGTRRIVHFAGHGTDRGFCFVDTNNEIHETDPGALCRMLAKCNVSIVIFAACHSAEAYQGLTFPYCIAMSGRVLDDAAMRFSSGYYDGIGRGYTVAEAFDFGVLNVQMHGSSLGALLYENGVVVREEVAKTEAQPPPFGGGAPAPRPRPVSAALRQRLEAAEWLLSVGQIQAAKREAAEALQIDALHGRANLLAAAVTLTERDASTLPGAKVREVEAQLKLALTDPDNRACARALLAAFKHEYYVRNNLAEGPPRSDELARQAQEEPGLSPSDAALASRIRVSAATRRHLGRLLLTR